MLRRCGRTPGPAASIRTHLGGGRAAAREHSLADEEEERRSLLIEKRGTPKAVLLSIRDYVRLAAPEPEVLRIIGGESKRKGTDKLTSREIDQEINAARAAKRKSG